MRNWIVTMFVLCALVVIAAPAVAKHHTPEERGKTLFEKTDFAGGSSACNSCHPGGSGIEKAGSKKSFSIMGGKQATLEDVVNVCIEMGNKGKPIAKDSSEMKDITAYIRSLAKTGK